MRQRIKCGRLKKPRKLCNFALLELGTRNTFKWPLTISPVWVHTCEFVYFTDLHTLTRK